MDITFDRQGGLALLRTAKAYFGGEGRGVAGSIALHVLFALMVLLLMLRSVEPPVPPPHFVPVDIVQVGDETTSPPAPRVAKIPQPAMPHATAPEPASANRPEGMSPDGTKPLRDDLTTKLNALAQLKQPQSNTKPLVDPSAAEAASSDDAMPGSETAYAVRDLIRAQILRRWTFNVPSLNGKGFVIALHVVVLRNGTVAKCEILDRERYTKDALYRDIALSARNAVLLSSPLTLPATSFGDQIELTLNLNPRDTLR
ncbi:MAG: hypothetical protein JSR60_05440 [Proteobacteria bacterium]|nr:hypothetical protein [Pseudomonadota bacterium]